MPQPHLRRQPDALHFHIYGLTRDEADYVLSTFPIVRCHDEHRYGRFCSRDLILHYYNACAAGDMEAWGRKGRRYARGVYDVRGMNLGYDVTSLPRVPVNTGSARSRTSGRRRARLQP